MPNILYLDKNIVVAVKPSGLLSEGEGDGCFPAVLAREIAKGSDTRLFTVHRLDRETEGIMVYALTQKAASSLSLQIQKGEWKKIYTAVLWGRPDADSGRLCDLLYYDRAKSKSYVVKKERKGVKSALLDYTVLSVSEDGKKTTVRAELGTGRTHQIRVQFASRGLSLCGDRRYGAPAEAGNSLLLCACELRFSHPITHEHLEFKITPSWES